VSTESNLIAQHTRVAIQDFDMPTKLKQVVEARLVSFQDNRASPARGCAGGRRRIRTSGCLRRLIYSQVHYHSAIRPKHRSARDKPHGRWVFQASHHQRKTLRCDCLQSSPQCSPLNAARRFLGTRVVKELTREECTSRASGSIARTRTGISRVTTWRPTLGRRST
jgi:hypothetical protein